MRRATVILKSSLLRALLSLGFWSLLAADVGAAGNATYPRLMGMNIGAKNYQDARYQQDLSRLDVVILGFYKGWQPAGYAPTPSAAMSKVVQEIKARHPGILVGQYTVMNEVYGDPADVATADLRAKLDANKWWLLNASGRKVQWTDQYNAWETNFTGWAAPDAEGRRWPEWLAERNYSVFFRDVPEFDIVYLDNIMGIARVRGSWKQDGHDARPDDEDVEQAHRAGHVAHWKRIRQLQPKALLIGNADNDLSNDQWRNQLDGAFLEGLMGEHWSIEKRRGWGKMMERYRAALENTREPKIVGFNVSGAPDDYRFFRYAYTSCLLDDGYFSFTDKSRGFSSVPWFDEYDYKLGHAQSAPPLEPWHEDIWRRDFENGVVLLNPTSEAKTVTLEPGMRRLAGKQDAAVNDGSAVTRLTLRSKDGIVLRR
ncbi:MAG TPA: putative glycoside hydrolase [Burkholderiales bacterium]|nr:putative glycoside hydrolase [Burkholderiales bacterium]